MKKYKSKYQKIIKVKEMFLQQAQTELDNAIKYKEMLEDRLDKLNNNLEKEYQRLTQIMESEQIDIFVLKLQQDYIEKRKKEKENLIKRIEEAGQVIEEKRKNFFLAKREKRKVELLEEKEQARFKKYQLKEEIKFMDELGSRRKDG